MKRSFLICLAAVITIVTILSLKNIYDAYSWRKNITENSKIERWKNSGAQSDILFKKNVKWGGFEDGAGPSLEHENWIVLGKSDLTRDDLHNWERGKSLTLAYSRTEGVMLIDPLTNKFIRLIRMKSDHPIDGYLEQELHKPEAMSTQGMVEAYDRATDLWELELERFDEDILSRKHFKGEIRENYLKLQLARNTYRELLGHVHGQSIYFEPNPGTIVRLQSADTSYEIMKSLALQSMDIANYADSFDN